MTPRASIIVCTCNRAEHLRRTLESMCGVRVPAEVPAELLVVDNGSSDGTREVVENTPAGKLPVTYLREPRRGQCFARNTGMARARGDLILFTDDDVRLPENWIAGMTEPILADRADAVTGGIVIPKELERSWMEPVHRGWLAATDGIDGEKPYTMFGANMAFSRRILEKVPSFDTELGPGGLGFGDEMLFTWQFLEAGFRLAGALDVVVEHHFEAFRLERASFLESARKRGNTQAYLDYHWRHRVVGSPRRKLALARLRLAYWRARRSGDTRREEGCAKWELELFQRVHYFRQWLIERERVPNYEPRGLVKQERMAA